MSDNITISNERKKFMKHFKKLLNAELSPQEQEDAIKLAEEFQRLQEENLSYKQQEEISKLLDEVTFLQENLYQSE